MQSGRSPTLHTQRAAPCNKVESCSKMKSQQQQQQKKTTTKGKLATNTNKQNTDCISQCLVNWQFMLWTTNLSCARRMFHIHIKRRSGRRSLPLCAVCQCSGCCCCRCWGCCAHQEHRFGQQILQITSNRASHTVIHGQHSLWLGSGLGLGLEICLIGLRLNALRIQLPRFIESDEVAWLAWTLHTDGIDNECDCQQKGHGSQCSCRTRAARHDDGRVALWALFMQHKQR